METGDAPDPAAPEGAAPAPPPLVITADMLAPTAPMDRRREFERGMSAAPPLTLVLIALNVVVFGWEMATGALESGETLLTAGALGGEEVGRGEVWRFGTSIFLHAGIEHLLGNCVALYILGMACEHAFGWARTLPIYLGAGLAGSLASVLVEPRPTVGASGAIFGLMGCVAATLHRHRARLYLRDHRVVVVLAAWALWSIATGFLDPQIANFAHIGGFLGGAAAALLVRPPLLEEGPRTASPPRKS